MPKPPVKRPVRQVDTSGQRELFPRVPADSARASRPAAQPTHFDYPDVRAIQVGGFSLEEHLKQSGIRDVFVIRSFLDAQDWHPFEVAYSCIGRPAYAPQAMLGLILYGIMQGQSSLRELEHLARINLSCWWLTGGIMPDHSVIGRFIVLHGERLTETFFESLTHQVIKATRSGVDRTAGDGTIVEAAASRYRLVKQEALNKAVEKQREVVASVTTPGTPAAAKLAQLETAQQVLGERAAKRQAKGKDPATTQINPLESDAVVQPLKQQGYGASYKPSVLANEQRVIVAQALHPSSETAVVPALLDSAARHGTLEESSWDAGYHCDSVLDAGEQRQVRILTPEGRSSGDDWNKQSAKQYPKSRFIYDASTNTYRCPAGQLLQKIGTYRGKEGYKPYTLYGTSACADCPKKTHCTASKEGRQVKRYPGDARKEALRELLQEEAVRERYRKRAAWVEPVFSVLKGKQRLTRFRRKGLASVRLEFALHAMAYNVGRVVARHFALKGLLMTLKWLFWAMLPHRGRIKSDRCANKAFCVALTLNSHGGC
jgi:transposase